MDQTGKPHANVTPGVRDILAQDRTILANERTYLAYVRTALTLFVAGVSFIKFFDTPTIELIGWVFIPIGALLMALGTWRYLRMRRLMKAHGNGSSGQLRLPGEPDVK